ncbi:MAG: 30S ribosomal protein S20 [Ignavibacteria bacterium]|nr:30S ribosomal protein S20 [Ignavibacteria bacterium]
MAHHKSALKRIRQSKKRRLYNRLNKKLAKDAIKAVKKARSYEEGLELLRKAYSVLDRIAARGIVHKNNASNKKSKLSLFLNKLKAQAPVAQ